MTTLEALDRAKAEIDSAFARAREEVSASSTALEEANQRTFAVRFVLTTALASRRWFRFDRKAFEAAIAEAIKATPNEGPKAVWHEVLKTESRRVLEMNP